MREISLDQSSEATVSESFGSDIHHLWTLLKQSRKFPRILSSLSFLEFDHNSIFKNTENRISSAFSSVLQGASKRFLFKVTHTPCDVEVL